MLKPGAPLSLECPCMDKVFTYIAKLVEVGQTRKSNFMTKGVFWGDHKTKSVAMAHKWGYFADELTDLMKRAGFRDVRLEEPRYHFAMRDMRVTGVK